MAILTVRDPPVHFLTDRDESIITDVEEWNSNREQLPSANDSVSTEDDYVDEEDFRMVRVAREMLVRPMNTARVLVRSTTRGLSYIASHGNLLKGRHALVANGTAKIEPQHPL